MEGEKTERRAILWTFAKRQGHGHATFSAKNERFTVDCVLKSPCLNKIITLKEKWAKSDRNPLNRNYRDTAKNSNRRVHKNLIKFKL